MREVSNRPRLGSIDPVPLPIPTRLSPNSSRTLTIALDDPELSPSLQLVKFFWDLLLLCIVLVGIVGAPADITAPRKHCDIFYLEPTLPVRNHVYLPCRPYCVYCSLIRILMPKLGGTCSTDFSLLQYANTNPSKGNSYSDLFVLHFKTCHSLPCRIAPSYSPPTPIELHCFTLLLPL